MTSHCITILVRQMWWLMHSVGNHGEYWLMWIPGSGRCSRLSDSSGSEQTQGILGSFGGYAFPTEQGYRLPG